MTENFATDSRPVLTIGDYAHARPTRRSNRAIVKHAGGLELLVMARAMGR